MHGSGARPSRVVALDVERSIQPALSVGARSGARRRIAYLRDVTVHLVRHDFATRHRGSLLGWSWALAPPLLQLLVTFFVFTQVIPLQVENYPVFLLTGSSPGAGSARGVTLARASLEAGASSSCVPGFPTACCRSSAALVGLLDYVVALPVLLARDHGRPGTAR